MKTLLSLLLVPLSVAAQTPLVIAHRGASGYLPEHTLAAYRLAIEQGAHFIEPDLVMTKDGVLVARHENEIGETTDAAERFPGRRTTKKVEGKEIGGWFVEDLTLAEVKTLRAKERIPKLRPESAKHDGRYEVPTFEEVLGLAAEKGVGVYPETKHAAYFQSINLPLERALADALARFPGVKAYVQSFEAESLRKLSKVTGAPLVQLLGARAKPDLADIATYAKAIGPHKDLLIPRLADGSLGTPTTLVRDAHARGLAVHPWTFRAENYFLPADYRSGADPAQRGDLAGELRRFLSLGIDGFFVDQPDAARDLGVRRK